MVAKQLSSDFHQFSASWVARFLQRTGKSIGGDGTFQFYLLCLLRPLHGFLLHLLGLLQHRSCLVQIPQFTAWVGKLTEGKREKKIQKQMSEPGAFTLDDGNSFRQYFSFTFDSPCHPRNATFARGPRTRQCCVVPPFRHVQNVSGLLSTQQGFLMPGPVGFVRQQFGQIFTDPTVFAATPFSTNGVFGSWSDLGWVHDPKFGPVPRDLCVPSIGVLMHANTHQTVVFRGQKHVHGGHW